MERGLQAVNHNITRLQDARAAMQADVADKVSFQKRNEQNRRGPGCACISISESILRALGPNQTDLLLVFEG